MLVVMSRNLCSIFCGCFKNFDGRVEIVQCKCNLRFFAWKLTRFTDKRSPLLKCLSFHFGTFLKNIGAEKPCDRNRER